MSSARRSSTVWLPSPGSGRTPLTDTYRWGRPPRILSGHNTLRTLAPLPLRTSLRARSPSWRIVPKERAVSRESLWPGWLCPRSNSFVTHQHDSLDLNALARNPDLVLHLVGEDHLCQFALGVGTLGDVVLNDPQLPNFPDSGTVVVVVVTFGLHLFASLTLGQMAVNKKLLPLLSTAHSSKNLARERPVLLAMVEEGRRLGL